VPSALTPVFQFIFRFEIGDAYLGAVSRFMSNAFEYGDALLPRPEGADEEDSPPQIESNQPYLSLATFRMVLLADEVLESFFETDLSASFRLEPVPLMELPPANNGFLGGLWSNIATDNNVKLFHKFSDEVGRTIGRHQVIHRPSIGRYTSIEDTRPRESLLTPAMRHSSSKSSLKSTSTSTESVPSAVEANKAATSSTLIATEGKPVLSPTSPAGIDPLAQATNVVANAFLERTPFAIDDAGDDDEDEDDEEEEEQDDVLDEVRFFGSDLWPFSTSPLYITNKPLGGCLP
jgi:TBC1 domain family member 8/9